MRHSLRQRPMPIKPRVKLRSCVFFGSVHDTLSSISPVSRFILYPALKTEHVPVSAWYLHPAYDPKSFSNVGHSPPHGFWSANHGI